MQTTNDTTVKASRTITPIEGTDGRFEWYQYNDDLRIIHDRETDTFSMASIARSLKISTKHTAGWLADERGKSAISGLKNAPEFGGTHIVLINDIPKAGFPIIVRGKYLHRLLVNRFASDICPAYSYKIALLLDDHFELQRKVEENRALSDKNKSLEQKVDQLLVDNRDLKNSMRVIQTKVTSIEVTLSGLVESVTELRNHVTSNKICRYIIVLWVIESESNDDTTIIRPFCGLRENLPKVDGRKVFEYDVPCSIDTFKETLERLKNDYYYKTYYRSIVLKTRYLDEFIEAFSYTFKRINRTVYDISAQLDGLTETVADMGSTMESKLNEIIQKYAPFMKQYDVPCEIVSAIGNGTLMFPYRGKQYEVHLRSKTQKPFIKINGKPFVISVANFRRAFL